MHQLTPIGLASDTLMTAALLASHALIDQSFSHVNRCLLRFIRIRRDSAWDLSIYLGNIVMCDSASVVRCHYTEREERKEQFHSSDWHRLTADSPLHLAGYEKLGLDRSGFQFISCHLIYAFSASTSLFFFHLWCRSTVWDAIFGMGNHALVTGCDKGFSSVFAVKY